MVLHPEH